MFQGSKFQFGILPYCVFALQSCSEVIIGRRTPEVGSQFAAVFHHLHSVHVVTAEITVVLVEVHREVFAFHNQVVPVVVQNRGHNNRKIGSLYVFQFEFRCFVVADAQLLVSDSSSCRQQCLSSFQLIADIEQQFLAGTDILRFNRELYFYSLLGRYFQVGYDACLYHFPVCQ